jgi:RHS repeat-associated protein
VITAPPSAPAAKKLTFKHTGGAQWWTVPDGLTAVSVEAWGAQGGGTMSGLGGYVQGTVTVIPGQTLQVNVGGQGQATGAGGYGGGGSAVANGGGGGGGGASEIRIGGVTRDDRALMAAGGGGQGSGATPVYGAGGAGGGFEGGIGQRGRNGLGGPNAIAEGAPGTQAGGNDLAGGGSAGCDAVCGGGGGGGYWGGGSGGVYPWSSIGSGGGGGSSHVTATVGSMVQSLAGVRQGHGEIRISWPPVLPLVTAAPAPGSASFAYTGQPQYWTVPAGVNGIEVETWGAEGGGAFGGKGGYVKATLPVAAGLVLQLNLGGAGSADGPGGWNGGANGVGSGDGGGGGTDVRVGGTHMSNRWVVAGGGGGQSNGANASYGSGGCGGGVEGCRGGTGSHWFMNPPYYYGADPGTQTGGAAPGQGSTASFCDPGSGCPGGGGGGYFGGGSGGTYTYSSIAGGGAGGSGFVTPYAVTGLLTQGGNSGNGRAVIRWPVPIEITQSFGDDPYGEVVASVSTGSGNLVQSARDIDVATAGPDLQLERTYNGLDTKAGAFGRGWSWTYETRLAEVDANNVTITHASGRREAHAKKADGTYTAPPGYASKLTRLADGWRLETKDRTVLHFDTGGALVRIIDRHGRTLELVSISGRLQRAQDIASGRTLTFTWVGDRITRVESSPVTIGATTAPLVWRYTYVADRLTRACDARYPTTTGEKCTVYGYDGSGRLTTVTTPKGHLSIKASYRTDGRVNWVENADGDRHTFAYGGAITQVTDPLGRKTSYLYDLRLRTARIIDPQVRATTFVYDEKGFRSQVINQAGFRTTSTHDARGNVLSQTNAEGATTWFTYDADDQLKERRDPRSASSTDNTYRTTFTYDRGEVATETSPPTAEKPAGVVKTSTYTVQGDDHGFGPVPGGLLRTHNDGAGTITYDYDGEGDRRRQTNPTGPTNPTGLITETDHDQLGRTRSTTQRIGAEVLTTDQDVDPIGQVVLVRDPRVQDVIDGHWHQRVTRTTFDQNTNPTRVEVTDEGGSTAPTPARVTTVDYDKVDRAFVVNDPEGGQATRRFDKKGNPVEVTDAMGRRFVTDYDANDRATQVTLVGFADDPVAGTAPRDVVVHRYEYDQVGRVVAERTPAPGTGGLAGQVPATSVPMVQRRTAYDRADRVTRLVVGDFVNRDGSRRDLEMSSYKFDLAGNVIEEKTGGAQRQLLHTYDQAGMRQDTTLVLPEGNRITEFDYDSQGNTTRAAVKAAPAAAPIAEARATYDPSGALTSEVVENGAVDLTTTHDVDAAGRRRSTTDPRGGPAYTTNFDYDVLGRLVQVTKPAVDVESDGGTPTATRPVRRLAYDAVGNKVTELDERGGRTRRTFDRLDRPTRLDLPAYTPPGGGTVQPNEQLRYDRAGNVLSKTDRRGQVTDWDYDARNRPVRQRDPLVVGETARGEVRTGYDDAGNAVRRTDQNGAVVRWSHDQLARPRSETVEVRQPAPAPPLSFTTTVDHDDLGNRTFTEDATGVQQTAKYNGASQLVDAVDDLGKISTTTYDVAGRPLTQKDPLNRKTRNTYDLAGRMLAVEQLKPLVDATVLSTTRFGYDPAGNRTEVRSARSSSPTDNAFLTTFGYDALNQLRSVVEPVDATRSVTTAYGYDAAGNRTRTTNGANATTVHTWNPWNASEATIEPATAAHPTASDRTFTTVYDSGGLPVEERQPGATVTRSFDALGQVRTEAGTGTGLAAATRTFSWDRAGRLTGFGDPAGAVTLVNDDRGLLLSASTPGDPATATSTFGYDGAGRMIRRTDGAGTTTATYDARGLLDVVTDPLTGGTTDHGRNDAGQVNGIAYATTPVTSRTVGFDDSGRIASDSLAQGTTQKWSATYGYDTESNVTAKTVTAPGNPAAGASTYDYDRMGRLNKWTNPATAVTTYDYDGAGNRTQAGADAFTYDARNRMLTAPGATSTWTARGTLDAVEQGAVTTDVDFDALGRQLKSGATTNDYDSLDRLTRTGATALSYAGLEIDPVTNGATKYARSPRGELVATNEGGAGRFVGEDRHGDVAFALSTTASVDATRVYDPWGKVVGAAGLTGLGVGFQGDVTDAATGQVWMGARWYDPATARFTSRDTVAGGTARPTQQNRYAYGLDDPLGQFDPDGRCSWCRDAWDATAGKVVTAFNDHVVQPVFNNVIKPVAQTAWKGGKALAGATGAAIRNGVSTAARAVGQAASACWQSQTCRRAAVGVALVAAGVAMPALVPGMAASGLFGLGTGAVTCGGNAGCMIDQTLGGIAGGLVPGGGLLRTISGEFVGSFTSQFLEGKIDGGRLFFDVTVGVLTDQAGKRMGTGLGRRDIGRSPANRRNISADNFGPAHRAQKKPAELLESGPYDDLAKRSVKDGMTPDHIPAHAANRREIEDKLGRKLTPEEDRDLHKKGICLMVPTCDHQQVSDTYGGRNSESRIAGDAAAQRAGAERSLAVWRKHFIAAGMKPAEVEAKLAEVHRKNVAIGRYPA